VDKDRGVDSGALTNDMRLAILQRQGGELTAVQRHTFPMKTYAGAPMVLFDGSTYWLAWSEADIQGRSGERIWTVQVRPNGELVAPPRELPGKWTGPIWVSLARSPRKLVAVVSHPNDSSCHATFIELARAAAP
jgi:hypothetical protein